MEYENFFKKGIEVVRNDDLYGAIVNIDLFKRKIGIACKYVFIELIETKRKYDVILKCKKHDGTYDMHLILFPDNFYYAKEYELETLPEGTRYFHSTIEDCKLYYTDLPYLFITNNSVICIYKVSNNKLGKLEGESYKVNNTVDKVNFGKYVDECLVLPSGAILDINPMENTVVNYIYNHNLKYDNVIYKDTKGGYSSCICYNGKITRYTNYEYIKELTPYTLFRDGEETCIRILDKKVYAFQGDRNNISFQKVKGKLIINAGINSAEIVLFNQNPLNYFIGKKLFLNNHEVSDEFISSRVIIPDTLIVFYCLEHCYLYYEGRVFVTNEYLNFNLLKGRKKEEILTFIEDNFIIEYFNNFISSELFEFVCRNHLLGLTTNFSDLKIENEDVKVIFKRLKIIVEVKYNNSQTIIPRLYDKDEMNKYLSRKYDQYYANKIISTIFK